MSCVYFAEQVGGNLVKIGWTTGCPKRRVASLQTGSPVKIKLAGFIPAETPHLEKEIHARFADLRVKGEWFRRSKEMMSLLPRTDVSKRSAKHMTLTEWCKRDGRHLSEIASEFGISLSQLYRLMAGEGTRRKTALKIQDATGGRVRAATLLGVDA